MSWLVFFSMEAQITAVKFRNAGRPSWCNSWWCCNDGRSADMMVAEWIWGSLSGHDSCQVNVDWDKWIGEDSMWYIRTSTTRCALTHAPRDDHWNTHCHGDANVQVDLVKKALQIEVRRVWQSKMLVSWGKSNMDDAKVSVVILKAEHNEVQKVRGCVVWKCWLVYSQNIGSHCSVQGSGKLF